jgi:hypothetical protein
MKTYTILALTFTACGQNPDNAQEFLSNPEKTIATPQRATETETVLKGETDFPVSLTLKSSSDLPICTQDRSGQLVWLSEEKEFRSCVPEESQWIVVSIRGQQGERGESGSAGASCSVEPSENGANVVCGENSVFVANGISGVSLPGVSGRDGVSCAAERGQGGVTITCGESTTFVADGQSIQGPAGNNGVSCSASRAIGGANITCGSNAPVFVADGVNGESIQGPQGIQGIQGVAGERGIQGIQGVAGQSARQVRVRMFPSFGTCPGGARTMWTSFYFDDNNNGYFDDADEEFMSESICEGAVGPKGDRGDQGIQGVAGRDGSDAAATKQLILYRDGVRIGPVIGENAGRSMNTNNALIVYVEAINRIMEFTDDGGSGGEGILFTSYYVNAAVGYIYNEYFDMRINAVAARIAGTCVVFENPSSTVMSVAGISYTSSGLAYSPTVTANQVRKVWRNDNFNNTIYCGNATPTFVYE